MILLCLSPLVATLHGAPCTTLQKYLKREQLACAPGSGMTIVPLKVPVNVFLRDLGDKFMDAYTWTLCRIPVTVQRHLRLDVHSVAGVPYTQLLRPAGRHRQAGTAIRGHGSQSYPFTDMADLDHVELWVTGSILHSPRRPGTNCGAMHSDGSTVERHRAAAPSSGVTTVLVSQKAFHPQHVQDRSR